MKISLCNELFGKMPFSLQCQVAREAGVDGIEIAPFTIADEEYLFPSSLAKRLRDDLQANGLGFAGLHWLLTKPDGLLLTSRDPGKRREAVDFLLRLADFSELLGGGIMTLGGPKQRRAADGVTVKEAVEYLNEDFRIFSDRMKGGTTKLAIEALSGDQTDVVNTFSESRLVLEGCGRGVTSMFDFHNTTEEPEGWVETVENNMDIIEHVHVNRMDGSCPGPEEVEDYRPTFKKLEALGYNGWYSLEDFTSPEDPLAVGIRFKQFMVDCLK